MNIDLPNDPALCFKQGWAEALNEVLYTLTKMQPDMPTSREEQKKRQELEVIKNIISSHLDISATLAIIQERK